LAFGFGFGIDKLAETGYKLSNYRIRTTDDIDYGEFLYSYKKSSEELEEEETELRKRYPTEDIAQYLTYPCAYCTIPFFRHNPIRGKNMLPYSEGYFIISKKSKKITAICNRCMLELSHNNDCEFTSSNEGSVKRDIL
jgi:hypothetical protein